MSKVDKSLYCFELSPTEFMKRSGKVSVKETDRPEISELRSLAVEKIEKMYARFDRKSRSVMEFIFVPLIQCRWTGSYDAHITSLCQLRNNFFSKISHKAQYYQLTLKISTKKEPLISQKSQILRFYVYSISPNCTILA